MLDRKGKFGRMGFGLAFQNIIKGQWVRPSLLVLHAMLILTSGAVLWPFFSIAPPEQSDPPRLLFLVAEDPNNYEAHRTIPPFARRLEKSEGWSTTVIQGRGDLNAFEFPGLEAALAKADLLVIFFRRAALRPAQMNAIKNYLAEGKPLVGIRTANHAFSVHHQAAAQGFVDWWDFVPDYFGHKNAGYGKLEDGTAVTPEPGAEAHPILKGVKPLAWQSKGSLYRVLPLLDEKAVVLLQGSDGKEKQPVAWTRSSRHGGRIFYTSLGYPDDFSQPPFQTLLRNGLSWAMGK